MTAPPTTDPIATKVAAGLTDAGIAFYAIDSGRLRVLLPNGAAPATSVEQDMGLFLRHLPEGATYKIYNEQKGRPK